MKRSIPFASKRLALKSIPAALVLALVTPLSFAGDPGDDGEGFHGYFRAGVGASSSEGGRQSCFGLGGNTKRYRLGNECDAFTYLYYNKELVKADDGASFVGTVGIVKYAPNSDFGSGGGPGIHRAYIEAKNLDFLNGGVAWVGKREYIRPDIHMLDLFYTRLNGTGAGIDKMKLGPGKFSYAIFKDNDENVADPATGQVTNSNAALRQNLVYQDLPVNTDGTLDFVTTFITAKGTGKHNGWNASVIHKQGNVFGGGNTIGVQYGVGPGTGAGLCCGQFGESGSTTLGSDVKRMRVFDSLWIQPSKQFSMEFVALLQRDKSDAGGTSTWTSLGVRPVYALSNHFKLQGELGTDKVKSGNGSPDLRLTKITFAPTITAGTSYWSRPELRAFVTYAKWNNAATAAVNSANEGGAVFGSRTNGTSYGVQVETWF